MTRLEAFESLKAVQNEFRAARFAVSVADRTAQLDPTTLPEEGESIRPSHLRDCLANLEATYALRIFAEFEWVLRDFWHSVRPSPRVRQTRTEILVNRVAARLSIPTATTDEVHQVREYRNQLAHRAGSVATIALEDCRSALGKFMSFLPLRW